MAWQRKKGEIWENTRQLFILHTLPPEHIIWTHLIYLFVSSTYIKQVKARCKALKSAAQLALRVPSSVALTEQSVAPPLPLYRTVTTVKHSTEKPILTDTGISMVKEETRKLIWLKTKTQQSLRKGSPLAPKCKQIKSLGSRSVKGSVSKHCHNKFWVVS